MASDADDLKAIRDLEAQAATRGQEMFATLMRDLVDMGERCKNLSTLQSLLPGVRDRLRRISENLESEIQSVDALQVRTGNGS